MFRNISIIQVFPDVCGDGEESLEEHPHQGASRHRSVSASGDYGVSSCCVARLLCLGRDKPMFRAQDLILDFGDG